MNFVDQIASLTGANTQEIVFVQRILLAAFLAAIIGWQRLRNGSVAGYRTHAIIAVAATAFTSVSVDRFPADTGRVIQGILTGVGFLGSGIIWKGGEVVRGVTTAAGIWAVTAIGIIIGVGEYFMGLSIFAITFGVLSLPARHR